MKCGWSKLDKIETDCEKANLKNIGLMFFKFKVRFSLKQVVNNKIRLRNQLVTVVRPRCVSETTFELRARKKNDTGNNRKKSMT